MNVNDKIFKSRVRQISQANPFAQVSFQQQN